MGAVIAISLGVVVFSLLPADHPIASGAKASLWDEVSETFNIENSEKAVVIVPGPSQIVTIETLLSTSRPNMIGSSGGRALGRSLGSLVDGVDAVRTKVEIDDVTELRNRPLLAAVVAEDGLSNESVLIAFISGAEIVLCVLSDGNEIIIFRRYIIYSRNLAELVISWSS